MDPVRPGTPSYTPAMSRWPISLHFVSRAQQASTGFLFPRSAIPKEKAPATTNVLLVIDDQSDVTFYLHYMSERGVKPGLEYRYYLNREAKGAVMFDFFHDDQIDNGAGDSSENGATTTPAASSCAPIMIATGSA